MVKPHEEKCAHEKFYGNILDYAKYLSTFVEMGVVRSINMLKSKLEDRGNMCMFLRYAQNYTGSTYHMFNISTKYIVLIRDVIWLNKPYGEYVSWEKIPSQAPIFYKTNKGIIIGPMYKLILKRMKSTLKVEKRRKC